MERARDSRTTTKLAQLPETPPAPLLSVPQSHMLQMRKLSSDGLRPVSTFNGRQEAEPSKGLALR